MYSTLTILTSKSLWRTLLLESLHDVPDSATEATETVVLSSHVRRGRTLGFCLGGITIVNN